MEVDAYIVTQTLCQEQTQLHKCPTLCSWRRQQVAKCVLLLAVFLQLHHCMSATIKFPKKRKQICKACPTNDCEGQIDYLRFVRTKKSFVNEADGSKSTSPFVFSLHRLLSVYELSVTHSFILYTLHCYPALLRSLRSLNQLKSGE